MARTKITLKKNESFLLTLVLAALGLMYSIYWYGPKKSALSGIDDQVSLIETEIAAKSAQIASMPVKAAPTVESRASQELMEKYRRSNGQLANVITSMTAADARYPFLLKSMSTASQSFSGGFTQVAYDIELEATFHSVGRFLQRLEDSPLLTELHSIEIERSSKEELKRTKTRIKIFSYALTGGAK